MFPGHLSPQLVPVSYRLSLFYPHGVEGACRHLDVICGITPQDSSATEESRVSIKLHMQRYPSREGGVVKNKNSRHVNVLVLENYMSHRYISQIERMINSMKFQQMGEHSKKYMRIATELERAQITFGNNINKLRIHEADTDMHKIEKDALKMSKFLQHVEDAVLSKFIDILTEIVQGDLSKPASKIVKKKACFNLPTPTPNQVFHYPISDNEPYDAPNSVVSHISDSNPYAPHSDSRPIKPFNHNNKVVCHHEDSMRIPTHCYAFSLDHSPVPKEIITIRHGLRNGQDDNFCTLIGCFSSITNKYVPAYRDDIPMGGSSHLHYQMAGSQGSLLHHLKRSTGGSEKNLVRIVMSTRRLRDPDVVMKEGHFGDKPPKVIASTMHCYSNTLSSMRGPVGIIPRSLIIPPQQRSSMRSGKSNASISSVAKVEWTAKKHKTGDLNQQEIIERKAIIGIPLSYPIDRIATSKAVVTAISKNQTSFRYVGDEKNVTIIGPILTENDNKEFKPIKPGDRIPVGQINLLSNIHSCTRSRKVTSISKDDTLGSGAIICRRPGKNTASLLTNSINAIKGEKLTNIVIRGEGGIISKASLHGFDCDNRHAFREAPTHTVAVGQFANQFSNSITNSCCSMQAFNLYYAPKDIGIYIGLFYVKEVSWKRLSKEECLDEFKEIERLTRELYQLDSRLMESPSLKEGTQNEVCSMLASSMHVTLTPLFPKLSDLNYDRPWKQFDVSIKDFCHPKIAVEKANLTSELGFFENAVGSVEDLLELCAGTMEFLTPEAKQRIFPGLPKSFPGTTFVPGSVKTYPKISDIFSAAIHSTGMTIVKTFEDDTVTMKGNCMVLNPPRKFLRSINFYSGDRDEMNLKPLFNRPLHPAHLSSEPAVVIAWESSKTCGSIEKRQENGSAYILDDNTKDEAFDVIFKCIMCSIFNPSALLQIFGKLGRWNVPSPSDVDGFVGLIKKFGWSRSLIIHSNFDGVFESLDHLIGFIQWSSSPHCQIVFQNAANGSSISQSRATAQSDLYRVLNDTHVTNCNGFSEFQVHVIMRTIENCILYPFGKPVLVQHGHGSAQAARFLKEAFECEAGEVDQQLIKSFNRRYNPAQKTAPRDHLTNELLVLGFDWCKQKKCLVHKFGIRKPFDELDAEHMLCMIYTMYQRTLPSRNEGLTSENDCPKCFPICYQNSPARDLDIMKSFKENYLDRINAYKSLLKCDSYEYRSLSDIFRIDITF